MALQSDALFADVDDLVKIEGSPFGYRVKRGIGRGLNFVPHPPAPILERAFERRIYRSHEGEPKSLLQHISAGRGEGLGD